MSKWPSWWPDGCPPDEAAPVTGEFYRFVADDVIDESDFHSARERADQGLGRVFWSEDKECDAVSCSTFTDLQDARSTQAAFGALRKKRIAKGDPSGSGVVLPTPSKPSSSHHSWWRPVGDQAWKTFKVIS